MRTSSFSRIPFNTEHRPLPEIPRIDPPGSISPCAPDSKPRAAIRDAVGNPGRGAGAAYLQRLRVKRVR